MTAVIRIGLIGDYDSTVPAHQAIPAAVRLAERASLEGRLPPLVRAFVQASAERAAR